MLYELVLEHIILLSKLIIVSIAATLIYNITLSYKSSSNLPPGPPSYPFIGNILDLKGRDLCSYFEECREKYGDVFCVRFFQRILIVFNGHGALKDAFVNHHRLFSDRPKVFLAGDEGIITASGKRWKSRRKFTLQTLRNFGMGKNPLQVKIHEEIEAVLAEVKQFGGKPFNIKSILDCAIANIICSVIFGKRFKYDDEEFLQNVERVNAISSNVSFFFCSRILKYIPGDPFHVNTTLRMIEEGNQFYGEMIDKHVTEFDENNIKDLIDAYILQGKATESETSTFDKHELLKIIGDLVGAGTETTATTLKWGIIYLLRDREIQNTLDKELQENVVTNRLPEMNDKPNLPFTEATVMEILRLGNITPLGAPHAAVDDCTFRGYHIPKDAFILPNIQSVLYDKTTWPDPLQFRPSRFINEAGKVIQMDQFIPFSLGRRTCLGESLAKMELFLFVSALVQRFEFLPPEGEEPPSLDSKLGITRAPASFMMRAIPRHQ